MTLFEQIERHEGRRRFPYADTVGKLTIGIGRNLTDKGLTDDEIDYLLSNDLKECRDDLATFPWWAGLDDVRRNVLLDMRFNLGSAGFRKFTGTLAAVAQGDYVKASEQMVKSKWASQVKDRAQRLARMMATGVLMTLFCVTSAVAQPAFPAKAMDAVNALYAGVNPQDDGARRVAIVRTCEQLSADLGPRWGGKKRAGLPDDFRSPDSLAFHEEDGSVSVWDVQASSGAILVHAGKTPDYPRLPASEAAFMGCEPKNHMGAPTPPPPLPGIPPPPIVIQPPIDLSRLATKEDLARLEQKVDAVKEDTGEIRAGMNRALKFVGKYIVPVIGALTAGYFMNPNEESK